MLFHFVGRRKRVEIRHEIKNQKTNKNDKNIENETKPKKKMKAEMGVHSRRERGTSGWTGITIDRRSLDGVGGGPASNVRARNVCRARRANAFRENVRCNKTGYGRRPRRASWK